jgi:hypothetical protein
LRVANEVAVVIGIPRLRRRGHGTGGNRRVAGPPGTRLACTLASSMKLFACPACGQVVFFGNVRCERCEALLGYEPGTNRMIALRAEADRLVATAGRHEGTAWRYCGNHAHDVCNWLLPADDPAELCRACRHNLTIPDLGQPENVALWRRMEEAKHRVLYTILRLRLPLFDRSERPDGLGFQFLRADDPHHKVITGHDNGLITIALVEADDAEREKRRHALGEPYRTLLGHFRHEVGHWYWNQLVRDTGWRAPFTALFGDADQDYAAALQRHYAQGPKPGWQDTLISSYAGSHPWEDFAETWAHYFHMIDTLDTGGSFGIVLQPKLDRDQLLSTSLDFDVYDPGLGMTTLADAWVALSSALNSFNRSMGLADPYPFVLSPTVIEKLGFVHALIRGHAPPARAL